jgi:hypothetical protein
MWAKESPLLAIQEEETILQGIEHICVMTITQGRLKVRSPFTGKPCGHIPQQELAGKVHVLSNILKPLQPLRIG